MLELFNKLIKQQGINNISDAIITARNTSGSYNIRLQNNSIKRNVVNATDLIFAVGDIVNISFTDGNKQAAKIIGRSMQKKSAQKTVYI